jgi:ATP-dependent RNA helicase DHX57
MTYPRDFRTLTWWVAFNAYGLLLFGGPIQLDTNGSGLLVDGWLRLRGWARIGVLVSRLRILLDEALRKRIDNPGVQTTNDGVITIVRRLVGFNGLDQ